MAINATRRELLISRRVARIAILAVGGLSIAAARAQQAPHTNGDAVMVFPALRTAVTGDLFARKWAPGYKNDNMVNAKADVQRVHDERRR